MPDERICEYLCTEDLNGRMGLSTVSNVVLVLIANIKRPHLKPENTENMFATINLCEQCTDVFLETLCTTNEKYPKTLLAEWKHPINLERHPGLLTRLINENNYDLISVLLDKFVSCRDDNDNLLNIAKYFLDKGDHTLLVAASKKCDNVNVILENGETFLTSAIKSIDDATVINRLIGAIKFDINKANKTDESPLMLVSEKLMASSVRLLISNGANVAFRNNMALDTAIGSRNKCKKAV